jgi:predicted methyltransferase
MKNCSLLLAFALVAPAFAQADTFAERVAMASVGDHRSAANMARNEYRNPTGTLAFFGFEDGQKVLEIWPGGGWYTEVLAPAIRDHGSFVIANWDTSVEGQPGYRYTLPPRLKARFEERPDVYDQVQEVFYSPPQSASLGDANSYDLVLTFRSVHGWVGEGIADDVFQEMFRVIKPGGVLGVVQHRAREGADAAKTAEWGYVPQAFVIGLAEAAGFELEAASEVNANPLDSSEHPEGVWTLPPSLELGDTDREKYLAIGESDRMTLKFRKPL